MSILKEIEDSLIDLAKEDELKGVYYGACNKKLEEWNYFVFNRMNVKTAGKTKGDFNEYYAVHIIHEDFIPEGYIYKVIQKVLEDTKGIKLAVNEDISFSYTRKGNTDVVVEIATIVFTKGIFRGDVIAKSRN